VPGATIQKLKLDDLSTVERAEVEAAMAGGSGYLADNNDIVALWLFTGMGGVAGIVAGFIGGVPMLYAREAMILAGAGLIAWTAAVAISTFGKRGCVFTSLGTYKIRGSRLTGVLHGDIKALKHRTAGRRHRFTVLELVTSDDRTLTLYAHRPWSGPAVENIQKARGGGIPVTEF
jgi:hypothetical protein